MTETFDAFYSYDSHSWNFGLPVAHPTSLYHSHSFFGNVNVDEDTHVITHDVPHYPLYSSYWASPCEVDDETLEMTHDIPNFFLVSSHDNL